MMVLDEETRSDGVLKAKVVTRYSRPFDSNRKDVLFCKG